MGKTGKTLLLRARRALTAQCVALLLGVAWGAEPARYVPPPSAPDVLAPGPGTAADVVLIAFSGRCALSRCNPPGENEDALAVALVPAALAAWRDAGLEVAAWTYRAHVDDDPARGRGFASALADLDRAVAAGLLGPGSATRVVLLGYSHGTQFAHLLAFERPEVPFAASVLLDSICLGFDDDHAARLVAALAPGVGAWPATGPFHVGCDVLHVPGVLSRLDLGDVVPWNVARSLEVRSGGQVAGVVRDARRNVRLDGSRAGIDTVDLPHLKHQASDEVDGPAFAAWVPWVLDVVRGR